MVLLFFFFFLDSSEVLDKLKTKQQYIPGLNYAGSKNKKQAQMLETASNTNARSKQNKQNKPVSQSNYKQSGSLNSPLLPTPQLNPNAQYYDENR